MTILKSLARVTRRGIINLGDKTELSSEQIMIKETALSFAKDHILPYANEWDAQSFFPVETIKKSAELGFGAIYVPEQYGGSGLGRLESSLIFEALSYGCASTSAFISIHNMVNWMIGEFGSESMKQEMCPQLSAMEILASYCLTEPNSGSDAAAMKTNAKIEGGDFVINGSKMFISGGNASDVYLVMCLTGEKEVSAILVDRKTPGISFGKFEKKMGWKNQPTTLVMFEDCRVPLKNLVGVKGEGFKYAMSGLNGGRINIASCSLGGAQYAFDRALAYTNERKQFDKKIFDFQNTQFKLAEMAAKIFASRLLVRAAARGIDANDEDKISMASMAKLVATEDCFWVADEALQLFGGYGYLHEYGIEKIVRDLRVHRILEGTNEIMKVIIARNLKKYL
jgi:alkylation response protein AidB-like acyl-CoA dehydrogenase